MTGVRRAGILGGGLIGMSWASLFLARGPQVTVVDPDPATADRLPCRRWPRPNSSRKTDPTGSPPNTGSSRI